MVTTLSAIATNIKAFITNVKAMPTAGCAYATFVFAVVRIRRAIAL
ncbi:hypothetical protein PI95_033830 [Hassallia byssoidea VB512170]|uniref:Uncharacterized protein n=1 Tax=Hassallia byssoidea VB512170 TaxID=1304833 RepID=A0A846HLA0_9CYAN|nr:hypothetical protein [Hassalia byssoidea]NEU77328.1 hypothetical protein [Hassalia byssoidea VB512170]